MCKTDYKGGKTLEMPIDVAVCQSEVQTNLRTRLPKVHQHEDLNSLFATKSFARPYGSQAKIEAANTRWKAKADKHRRKVTFQEGD